MSPLNDYKQPFCVRVFLDQHLVGEQHFVSTMIQQTGFEVFIGRVNAEFGADTWNRIELIKEAAQ